MTQYLLAVHNVKDEPMQPEDEFAQATVAIDALNAEIEAAGAWVFAGGLRGDASTATVVRAVNGEVVTTDGPFAESKETLGGFWIIEAENLDAALVWAGKATVACGAPVEVRPFWGEDATSSDIYEDVKTWGATS